MPPIEAVNPSVGFAQKRIIRPGRESRYLFELASGKLQLVSVRCLSSDKGGAIFYKPIENIDDYDEDRIKEETFLPEDGATLHSLIMPGRPASLRTGMGLFMARHIPSEDNSRERA